MFHVCPTRTRARGQVTNETPPGLVACLECFEGRSVRYVELPYRTIQSMGFTRSPLQHGLCSFGVTETEYGVLLSLLRSIAVYCSG